MIDEDGNLLHSYEGATYRDIWPSNIVDRYDRFIDEITRNYSLTIPVYVFGVMRRDVLATTHLQRHYLGQDDNLVAEMMLAGEVCEIPEILKLIRSHPGSSSFSALTRFRAGTLPAWDGKHLQQWYRPGDNSALRRVLMLGWRHHVENFRLISSCGASPSQKLQMYSSALRALLHRAKTKAKLQLQPLKANAQESSGPTIR
jgi:hypothetical protein